jgi:hypothetical protein
MYGSKNDSLFEWKSPVDFRQIRPKPATSDSASDLPANTISEINIVSGCSLQGARG